MLSLRKHKERVEIIAGNTRIKKKKCVVEGTKVVIEKPRRGKGNIGWTPQFKATDFLYYKKLGFLRRKLVIKQDAKNFIPFGAEPKDLEVPTCTRKDIEEYGNAQVINKAGKIAQTLQVPIFLYLIIGGILILEIIQFLTTQGMMRP